MPVSGVRSDNVAMTRRAQFDFCVMSVFHQQSGAKTSRLSGSEAFWNEQRDLWKLVSAAIRFRPLVNKGTGMKFRVWMGFFFFFNFNQIVCV